MSNQKKNFDCIIPLKSLDVPLLLNVIENIQQFIHPSNIILITNANNALPESLAKDVILLDEDKIIPHLTLKTLQNLFEHKGADPSRAGWYFQQFLKMSYARMNDFTFALLSGGGGRKDFKNHPYYLVWDADSIPLKPLDFIGDKVLFEISNEYHKPYFETLEKLAIPISLPNQETKQLQKTILPSFITEHMMIERSKMLHLIDQIESIHQKPFYQAILDCINPSDLNHSGFSEFETYGNFVAMSNPDELQLIKRKRDRKAKAIIGSNPNQEQLLWYGKTYDICGIESWDRESWISHCTKKRIFRLLSPRVWKIIDRLCTKIFRR